jgi:hypothetical protein
MSTRMSLFYRPPLHVYVELRTDWVRLAIGAWLNIGLYKRLRGIYRPRWLGRLACRWNQHDWFLKTPVWVSDRLCPLTPVRL